MARKLYEIRITTFTRVFADSQDEAESFAQEALETVEFENVTRPGELCSFSTDAADAIEEEETEEETTTP